MTTEQLVEVQREHRDRCKVGRGGGERRGGEGRGTYRYQVELLKDEMEETTEQLVEVQREHRDRCKVGRREGRGGEGRGGEGDVPLPGGAAEGRNGGDDGTRRRRRRHHPAFVDSGVTGSATETDARASITDFYDIMGT